MEQTTQIQPAYDCMLTAPADCSFESHLTMTPERHKQFGRGGVKIRHILKADDLATQFVWSPGVYLPETVEALRSSSYQEFREPMGWDLGWHVPYRERPDIKPDKHGYVDWPWPFYGTVGACDIYGGDCFYDGSGLNAEPVLDALIRKGDKAVWALLAEYADELRQRMET